MKIALITNRAAYYRVPIFLRIAAAHDAEFFFTARDPGRWWTERHPDLASELPTQQACTPLALARALHSHDYDCVVGEVNGRAHLAVLAAEVEIQRWRFVAWVDMWSYPQSPAHALGRPLVRRLLRRADAVVSSGTHVTDWIGREVGRSEGIFCMPQAVDNDLFRKVPAQRLIVETRRDLFPATSVVGCFVGRLEPEKGLDILLTALSHTDPALGLAIVGSGSCEDAVRRDLARLDLRERVRLTGWVSQAALPAVYHACDFLIVPSRTTRLFREPWALVANEAMNASRPVVASDCVGAAAGRLITDYETGLVVPENDPWALAEAMNILTANKELRTALGDAAYLRVQEFNFDTAAAAFLRSIDYATVRRGRDAQESVSL